ncbi:MAG: hypothetical protein KW788_01095 [Candidatus Doudnabacteria bacterium]|nr:hypothetical protein [Candidatus Doudnabacteria bacterium]
MPVLPIPEKLDNFRDLLSTAIFHSYQAAASGKLAAPAFSRIVPIVTSDPVAYEIHSYEDAPYAEFIWSLWFLIASDHEVFGQLQAMRSDLQQQNFRVWVGIGVSPNIFSEADFGLLQGSGIMQI